MSHILDLSDELLFMICQYALCPAQGLSFTGKPTFKGKSNLQCADWKRIAAGLFLTNHRLSRIAIPITYGENTFCFKTELRAIVEFFLSLPPKNLKQIKRIYLPDPLQTSSEISLDIPLLQSVTTFLSQSMSLNSFSIAVPQSLEMGIGRGNLYRYSNHEQVSSIVLHMLKDGHLKEVRFIQKRPVEEYSWDGEASIFGDDIIKNYVEHILFNKETYKDLQERRRLCIKWENCKDEELEKVQAVYRDTLIGIMGVWENAGVMVERESSYLETPRSTVVIKSLG